jgi:hypothetical protein
MTHDAPPVAPHRPRFTMSQAAWLIVATLMISVGVLYAGVAPLLTKNPAGIPLGVLVGVAGVAIAVVARRSRRA